MMLIDESVNFELLNACKQAGIDFICVGDLMPGAADNQIIKYPVQHSITVITEDKDFGELVFNKKMNAFAIIFFTLFAE